MSCQRAAAAQPCSRARLSAAGRAKAATATPRAPGPPPGGGPPARLRPWSPAPTSATFIVPPPLGHAPDGVAVRGHDLVHAVGHGAPVVPEGADQAAACARGGARREEHGQRGGSPRG